MHLQNCNFNQIELKILCIAVIICISSLQTIIGQASIPSKVKKESFKKNKALEYDNGGFLFFYQVKEFIQNGTNDKKSERLEAINQEIKTLNSNRRDHLKENFPFNSEIISPILMHRKEAYDNNRYKVFSPFNDLQNVKGLKYYLRGIERDVVLTTSFQTQLLRNKFKGYAQGYIPVFIYDTTEKKYKIIAKLRGEVQFKHIVKCVEDFANGDIKKVKIKTVS